MENGIDIYVVGVLMIRVSEDDFKRLQHNTTAHSNVNGELDEIKKTKHHHLQEVGYKHCIN